MKIKLVFKNYTDIWNMLEKYKDIKGYEGLYQVSNFGNVKSLKKKGTPIEIILKACNRGRGYLAVSLVKDKVKKIQNIHQLVAIAFLNHNPDGHKLVVDHIDNNNSNNNVNNLQLISNRQNLSKDKKGGYSSYVGVSWDKNRNQWVANIHINGKHKHLGRFAKEILAAKAYQKELSLIR